MEEITCTPQLAAKLDVPAGTRALIVRRVKVYGDARIGLITDYVPEGVLPFQTFRAEFCGSILDILLDHTELEVDYSDCEIEPIIADAELAATLDIAPGTPALYLDELTRTRWGQTVNWSQAWLLPEHLRFFVRRRRQFTP